MKILRVLAAILILSVGVTILAYLTRATTSKSDYISYWASGQQLIHHRNPYDGQSILKLEREQGFAGNQPFLMRNPPWALFLAVPLGLFSATLGSLAWSIAMLGCLMVSIHLLRRKYGPSESDLHLAAYVFPPAIFCLIEGQIGLFLLFGIALFLYFEDSRPYLAGASLLILAAKPHLFLPFGVVFLLWLLTQKAYSVLIGAAIAFAFSVGLAVSLDHSVFAHYRQMLGVANIQNDFIPTISQLLRIAIRPQSAWIQIVPAGVGCLWAIFYFWKRRTCWNWSSDGVVVLLVSMIVSPYSWFADQAVLLVAILLGIYKSSTSRSPLYLFLALAAVCIVGMMLGIAPRSYFYVWTTPAWLAWYIFATRGRGTSVGVPRSGSLEFR